MDRICRVVRLHHGVRARTGKQTGAGLDRSVSSAIQSHPAPSFGARCRRQHFAAALSRFYPNGGGQGHRRK